MESRDFGGRMIWRLGIQHGVCAGLEMVAEAAVVVRIEVLGVAGMERSSGGSGSSAEPAQGERGGQGERTGSSGEPIINLASSQPMNFSNNSAMMEEFSDSLVESQETTQPASSQLAQCGSPVNHLLAEELSEFLAESPNETEEEREQKRRRRQPV